MLVEFCIFKIALVTSFVEQLFGIEFSLSEVHNISELYESTLDILVSLT